MNEIRVSAVVMRDSLGRVLNVRKRDTSVFMLPGGKPESGESPKEAALREFAEELGVSLDPQLLDSLGEFRADAANETGFTVIADVFVHPFVSGVAPHAEIAELKWADPHATHLQMAPLNTEVIFPKLLEGDTALSRSASVETDRLKA